MWGIKIEGGKRLRMKLRALSKKQEKEMTVDVGYSKVYAIYVHENLTAYHPVGEAKFLEKTAREEQHEISRIITMAVINKDGLETALTRGGKYLLLKTEPKVPVDTGALKASGYVRIKKGAK